MKFASIWIIIDNNKRLLLIKRSYKSKIYPSLWAIPWWRWNENESPEDIVIREIKEEVWLNFEPENLYLEEISEIWWIITKIHKFLWKHSWTIIIQENECDWYGWYNYDEIKKLDLAFNHLELVECLKNDWIIF